MTTRRSTGSRVLIVEDNPDIRAVLADILQGEGYGVDTADNGREALDHLASSPPPCLILLDLGMPVMDGRQFREQQQQDPLLSLIPVALVTALADQERAVAGLNATAVFRKPIDMAQLLETVRQHCG